MRILLLSTLLLGCWAQDPNADAQYINYKSVKGGGGQYQYRGGENLVRFYNNTQSGYGVKNYTAPVSRVGICFMEVPTASLARDPKHVPAGNGSRPDLSRIETCCAGYIRNIHNFHLCDPVCATECVNALCTAPNVCTCFPDHVKNLAGFCVATCPIGCQNGHCAGGECLCKEGFELDRDGKFCVPRCRGNCGGIGNCTAPNICSCRSGYHSTPDGSCQAGSAPPYHQGPSHQGPSSQSCGNCTGGDCVGTECRCRPGYLLYKGVCYPVCNPGCLGNTRCVAPNVCSSSSAPTPNPININQYPYQNPQYPYPNQPQNINGQYPGNPQNQNSTIHGQYPNQYPGQYPHTQNNTIHGQYPNQNSGQYPQPINNTFSVNYPYPNGQTQYSYNQFSENQQNHTSQGQFINQYYTGPNQPQPNPLYAQYPNGQPNPNYHQQYPNQPNNSNTLHHGQYPQQPGQQRLYPELPQNQYPYTNQASNRTDGQVYHLNQNTYNPLENMTFNLHQGGNTQGQTQYGTQGTYGQGQHVPQGLNNQGQTGPYGQSGQLGPDGRLISQGQYGQTQFTSEGQQQSLNWADQSSQCAQPCINGNCVGPNKCECFSGHVFDQADPTGVRCVPHCPGGCLNGYCAAPNTCMCMMGYHKDFSVKGRSVCVKRDRRSVEEKPVDVAELLVYEIPDY